MRLASSSESVRKGTKFDCAKSWTGNYGQNVRLPKSLRVYALPSERSAGCCKLLSLTTLDELDLEAFGGVNESNSTGVRRMWSVGQWMTFCGGVFGELVQIVDFKCEMRQIRAYDD